MVPQKVTPAVGLNAKKSKYLDRTNKKTSGMPNIEQK
jgi:hypothetical protein